MTGLHRRLARLEVASMRREVAWLTSLSAEELRRVVDEGELSPLLQQILDEVRAMPDEDLLALAGWGP